MDELQNRFAKVTVTAALQCAGNRRTELLSIAPIRGEIPWAAQAIGTATWSGAVLADVLWAADLSPEATDIAFCGLDTIEKNGATFGFGGSISRTKGMSPEVILAYEMDGKPLPPEHGFPLRVLVPGYPGARSVKWLGAIRAQRQPSSNFFQAYAYKIFPPHITEETADWATGKVIEEMPVNSVICVPSPGESFPVGPIEIRGYAIGRGGDSIDQVQVSTDDGRNWIPALVQSKERWAWSLWQLRLELPAGRYELMVRARDASGNTQPPDANSVWNFKGYAQNAWHRVQIRVGDV